MTCKSMQEKINNLSKSKENMFLKPDGKQNSGLTTTQNAF